MTMNLGSSNKANIVSGARESKFSWLNLNRVRVNYYIAIPYRDLAYWYSP